MPVVTSCVITAEPVNRKCVYSGISIIIISWPLRLNRNCIFFFFFRLKCSLFSAGKERKKEWRNGGWMDVMEEGRNDEWMDGLEGRTENIDGWMDIWWRKEERKKKRGVHLSHFRKCCESTLEKCERLSPKKYWLLSDNNKANFCLMSLCFTSMNFVFIKEKES